MKFVEGIRWCINWHYLKIDKSFLTLRFLISYLSAWKKKEMKQGKLKNRRDVYRFNFANLRIPGKAESLTAETGTPRHSKARCRHPTSMLHAVPKGSPPIVASTFYWWKHWLSQMTKKSGNISFVQCWNNSNQIQVCNASPTEKHLCKVRSYLLRFLIVSGTYFHKIFSTSDNTEHCDARCPSLCFPAHSQRLIT